MLDDRYWGRFLDPSRSERMINILINVFDQAFGGTHCAGCQQHRSVVDVVEDVNLNAHSSGAKNVCVSWQMRN